MRSNFLIFLKYTGAYSLLLIASFLVGTKVLYADPTYLHLDPRDGQDGQVQLTHATLVLVVGNYVDKLPLDISPDGVDVNMDPSWIRANWPGGKNRLKNVDRAYLYLRAEGYAPIVSSPINWMGSDSAGLGKDVVVSFPGGKVAMVGKGRKLSLTVNFRKPIERFVRLSNGKGKPLSGIKVKSYIYWSKSADGKLNGADFLGEGISDDTGRVPVTDGDFTYAIQVTQKATSGHPADTVLIVKRFEDKEYPLTVPDVSTVDSQEAQTR